MRTSLDFLLSERNQSSSVKLVSSKVQTLERIIVELHPFHCFRALDGVQPFLKCTNVQHFESLRYFVGS